MRRSAEPPLRPMPISFPHLKCSVVSGLLGGNAHAVHPSLEIPLVSRARPTCVGVRAGERVASIAAAGSVPVEPRPERAGHSDALFGTAPERFGRSIPAAQYEGGCGETLSRPRRPRTGRHLRRL